MANVTALLGWRSTSWCPLAFRGQATADRRRDERDPCGVARREANEGKV